MAKMSASLKLDTEKTNIDHNNRAMSDKEKKRNSHIDYSRSDENKYLVQEDIKKIYEREFGEALEKYNAKQKRKDRKIKDYYKHVQKSKKTKPQQEMIIQVGDKDDFSSKEDFQRANEILLEWFGQFEERNPNLKVYNAVIHNDEATPHLHLNFVPVATGYKRGLEKQVSFNKAISSQDKNFNQERPFEDWRAKEIAVLEKMMLERGIERKLVGTNKYEDVNEFKKVAAEREKLAKERESLENEKRAFFENQIKNIEPADEVNLTYSHKEKAIEEYETVEKNFFGKEKVVVKEREIETENYVMTPKQIQKVNKVFNDYKHLKSEYRRLEGVLSNEIDLRNEQEQNYQNELKTLKRDINERAERLKDEKYKELEKANSALRNRLIDEQRHYDVLADDHTKISTEKQNLEENLGLAVADNERLYEENSKLRERVDYYKWRFNKLWEVTKDYLGSYAKDGIETVKTWFQMDTGEEIEPKPQKQKNKNRSWDMER